MGKQRTRYTPEERAERDAADEAIKEKAREIITDPDALARMVAQLLTIPSPRILGYSLRNQAMLFSQAAEREAPLSDVDTYRGWRERGRGVLSGEKSYRIVLHKGTEAAADENADTSAAEAPKTGEQAEGESKGRQRFRMGYVFDISQTEGFDDTADGHEAAAVEDPAEALRATLTDQLERYGYTITTGDVPAAEVVDDPPTVTVPEGAPVVELARALGSLISRPPSERPKMRPPERPAAASDAGCITPAPDGSRRVRLDLGDAYGTVTATVRANLDTGATVYHVKGSRVFGAFSVHSTDAANAGAFHSAHIRYGDWSEVNHYWQNEAPDLPTVNGVTITGGTSGITPEEARVLTHRRIHPRRPTGLNTSTEAPQKTTERTAAVLRAILADWLARDDLDQLHTARAQFEAPGYQVDAARQAHQLDEHVRKITAERDEAAARAARYAAVAAGPTPADVTAVTSP